MIEKGKIFWESDVNKSTVKNIFHISKFFTQIINILLLFFFLLFGSTVFLMGIFILFRNVLIGFFIILFGSAILFLFCLNLLSIIAFLSANSYLKLYENGIGFNQNCKDIFIIWEDIKSVKLGFGFFPSPPAAYARHLSVKTKDGKNYKLLLNSTGLKCLRPALFYGLFTSDHNFKTAYNKIKKAPKLNN